MRCLITGLSIPISGEGGWIPSRFSGKILGGHEDLTGRRGGGGVRYKSLVVNAHGTQARLR